MFNDRGLKVLVSMAEALVFEHGVGKNRPNGHGGTMDFSGSFGLLGSR
jgi:hypothetical protein